MCAHTISVLPDMRIIDPVYGDITEDVARELARAREERNLEEAAAAQRRQNAIAATCGQESRIGANGLRLVAQIDESVYGYWEAREGRDFWKHELKYMLKRHPELAVKPRSERVVMVKPDFAKATSGRPDFGGAASDRPEMGSAFGPASPKASQGASGRVRGRRGRWAA